MNTTMDIHQILKRLPHRYPMLLVDRVLEIEKDTRILAIKNVTINEPFFMGHFPHRPVMPGVLILEAMAQPCTVDGRELHVSCSIGMATYPQHGAQSVLITHAAVATRASKAGGGAAYSVFDPRMVNDVRDQAELLNDLRLRDRRDLLKEIFEAAIPTTEQDVIVVFVSASGLRSGRLVQDSYSARILGTEVAGHRLSAIQRTTAAGICTALDLVVQGRLPQQGFVGQEAVALQEKCRYSGFSNAAVRPARR